MGMPFPCQTFVGPTLGVVDGGDARPGMVGEFLQGQASITYPGYPGVATTTVPLLVLSAGDWDIWSHAYFTSIVGGSSFWLNPVPAGMSNDMGFTVGPVLTLVPAGRLGWYRAAGVTARGSFGATTLLPFSVQTDQSASSSLPGGTIIFTVEARRRR